MQEHERPPEHMTPAEQHIHAAPPTAVTDDEATAAARNRAEEWEDPRGTLSPTRWVQRCPCIEARDGSGDRSVSGAHSTRQVAARPPGAAA
jgi:hypothetical protein